MISALTEAIVHNCSPQTVASLARKLPRSVIEFLALMYFRKNIRWAAAHSPFYRRVFRERGIDPRRVRTPADLGDFYTQPQDIVDNAEQFICRPPSIVFESSGTTGKNKRVYYSEKELRHGGTNAAIGMFMMGIDRTDRVANAFDFSMWIPGMLAHYGLMAAGVLSLAFGKVDPLEVYRRIGQYGFTVIMGEPTWLIRLTELAEQNGAFGLKLLIGGAEAMPPDAIGWMERVWAPAKVRMNYGSVELGGTLGFQFCGQTRGCHVDIIDYLPEIIEPDDEGFGEIVFTTLSRKTMPLIRYRTRDVARFENHPCPCGFSFPLMSEIRGRRDEMVVASGGNLYPLMFEKILGAVDGLTYDWQVVFRLNGVREIMEINVETACADKQLIEEQIRRQMAIQYPDLMKNLALGIFQLHIVAHAPGSLRPARKLKRMVDLRYTPEKAALRQ